MTNQELNVRIAELCGWEFKTMLRQVDSLAKVAVRKCRHAKHTHGKWQKMARLTQYTECLNAAHKMVQGLDIVSKRVFAEMLWDVDGVLTIPHEHRRRVLKHHLLRLLRGVFEPRIAQRARFGWH